MKWIGVLAAAAIIAPAAGYAQGQRDGTGIRAGSFIISPGFKVTQGLDSNFFLEEDDATLTSVSRLAPRVGVESDWRRHAVRLDFGAEYGIISQDFDDNYLDYNARFRGVADFTRDIRLNGELGFRHGHERRGEDDVPIADLGAVTTITIEPVEFDEIKAGLEGDINRGRFRLAPFGEVVRLNFDDAATVITDPGANLISEGVANQDDRDRVEVETGVEVGYAVQSGYEAFLRGSYFLAEYDEFDDALVAIPGGTRSLSRDSDGFRILAGTKIDLTRLIEASLGVGFEQRSYDDEALEDFSGVSADIDVVWDVTPLTNVFVNISREIEETSVFGATNFVDTGGFVGVTHDLRRNLSLQASLSYVFREFDGAAAIVGAPVGGLDREDQLFDAAIGADWQVNRRLTISPRYRFGLRESTLADTDYIAHIFDVSADLRF
ncbi:MAG: outer membrane beta-barrel protein [Pseudomonadota bacterium]